METLLRFIVGGQYGDGARRYSLDFSVSYLHDRHVMKYTDHRLD